MTLNTTTPQRASRKQARLLSSSSYLHQLLITTKCKSSRLVITILLVLATVRQLSASSTAHQRPTIYTIATSSSHDIDQQQQHRATEDHHHKKNHHHQRPYSWDNRRLSARELILDGEDGENLQRPDQSSGRLLLAHKSRSHVTDSDAMLIDKWTTSPVVTPRRGKTGSRRSNAGTKNRTGSPAIVIAKRKMPSSSETLPRVVPKDGVNNATTTKSGKRKHLVCYYGTWAVYRPDGGKFSVENIDPFLCTHVIYGFTGLSFDNLIKPLDPWNDLEDNYGKGAMKRFTNLKRINPDLKTLVAIGGWNEGSIKYSKMASEPEARTRFVQSVVQFLTKYNFDGLDLDWEYPGSRGGASYDKQNFVRLLRELSEAFKPHGYLLTAAVSAGKWFIDPAYDIPQVSKYLDLINLMAYDYHGGWETKTGMNAPLFPSAKHDLSQEDRMLNVNWSVNYWLSQGASREKLLLGVGSYGRSFTLDRESESGLNAPASQKGRAGPYTREAGSLGYNEICESLARSPQSWTIVRDPDYLAPYAFTNNGERQWVGYDDQKSLGLKAQFAKSMGLGGMMMWSIETDDFQGRCHGGEKFPLLNTIRRVLDGSGDVLPPPPPPLQPAAVSTTTTKRPGHEVEEVDEQRPASSSTTTTTSTKRPRPTSSTASSSTLRPTVAPSGATSRRPPIAASSTTSTPRPVSTSTRAPYRPPPPSQPQQEFTCRSEGLFADPRNCRKFFRCVGAGTPFTQRFTFDCGPGTAFSEQLQACDHIYNVNTCSQQRNSVTITTADNSNNGQRLEPNPETPIAYQRQQILIVPAVPPIRHLLAPHFLASAGPAYQFHHHHQHLRHHQHQTSAAAYYPLALVNHWRS